MSVTRWAAAAGCATLVLSLAACSSRSPEALCEEMDAGYAKIQANMDAAGDDAMAGLGSIFVNFGEYTTMLHKMQEKAPEEISGDLDDAVKVWDAQADRAGDAAANPLGALASTFMASMMASASMNNVDAYTQQHCGRTVFAMAAPAAAGTGSDTTPAPAAEDSPTAEPTPVIPDGALAAPGMGEGSTLSAREAQGSVAIAGSYEIAPTSTAGAPEAADVVVSVFSTATMTKTMAYRPSESGCSWGFGPGPDGRALMLAQEFEEHPAAGLEEASWTQFLVAFDATTGEQVWRSQWEQPKDYDRDEAGCQSPGNGEDAVTFTSDGKVAAFGNAVFDLRDGSYRYLPDLIGAVGAWVLSVAADTGDYNVLDPASGKRLGSVPGRGILFWSQVPADATGVTPTWQDGSLPLMAASAEDGVAAYQLPTGKLAWDVEAGGVTGYSPQARAVVVEDGAVSAGGRELWREDSFRACAVDGASVIGDAATMVQLDAATGEQVAFDEDSSCGNLPAVFSGGVLVPGDGYVTVDDSGLWSVLTR